MNEKIRKNINKYLEFDCSDLFNAADLVTIFGGAVRDSIANQPINDVDILIGSKSVRNISTILERNDYIVQHGYVCRDMDRIYADIHIISEPFTFMKGSKKVQLIRPRNNTPNQISNISLTPNQYKQNYYNLIENVDLSCCGVSFNENGLIENVKNAILHCEMLKYKLTNGTMTNIKRLDHRVHKMQSRGWVEIKNEIKEIRNHKINGIINY